MKDIDIEALGRQVESNTSMISAMWEKLKHLEVKECPKCNHPVLAKVIYFPIASTACIGDTIFAPLGATHQCLTCGVKFTCNNKEVCEIIE